jgi:hypothetical protein
MHSDLRGTIYIYMCVQGQAQGSFDGMADQVLARQAGHSDPFVAAQQAGLAEGMEGKCI